MSITKYQESHYVSVLDNPQVHDMRNCLSRHALTFFIHLFRKSLIMGIKSCCVFFLSFISLLSQK